MPRLSDELEGDPTPSDMRETVTAQHSDETFELELAGGVKIRSDRPILQTRVINAAEIVGADGMTDKERNQQLQHSIELGSLVEVSSGVRLFVVHLGRDCDRTPLYWLCHSPKPLVFKGVISQGYGLRQCLRGEGITGGYSEDGLTVIAGPERAYEQLDQDGWYSVEQNRWLESPYYGESL